MSGLAGLRDPMRRRALLARVRSRAFLAEAAVLSAVGLFFAAVFFVISTRLIVKSADSLTLDDLTGRDAGDAAVWCAGHGLRAEIDHFEDNDRAAPLTVVFQDPPPGEEVRPGYAVRLVISRGAKPVPVPDVRAGAVSQAHLILERNGLAVGQIVDVHDDAPVGTVLATSPSTNASVLAGTPVALLVSAGPAPRAWVAPDITFLGYDSVQPLAETMGLTLEIGQRMHAQDEPDGAILEQFPAPGSKLVEGQPFRVTVNGDVGIAEPTGGAQLVELMVEVPKGFGVHHVAVTIARPGVLPGTTWTRTLFEEPVPAGEKLRIPAAVMPGDRAMATLDGKPILSRRF